MIYTKPQLLNVKKASSTIMGNKQSGSADSSTGGTHSSVNAYRSDE
jgi:hypothetical protein